MKKIYFLSFLLLGFIVKSQAQTKLIAHKSHSGSLSNFKIALEGNLFDMGASDFGDPGWVEERHRLDSLVKVDDRTVNMYVTLFCKRWSVDTIEICHVYNRRMTSTPYSEAEYEEDVLVLLEQSTRFDFPVRDAKIIGYKKKFDIQKVEVAPSNYDRNYRGNDEVLKSEEEKQLIKNKDEKANGKKKRSSKKMKKKSKEIKKIGKVEGDSEVKVCTKPKIEIPVFIEEQSVEKEKIIVEKNRGRSWIAIVGLAFFSLLLGGFVQVLKAR